jgi:hypothetical protein
MITIIAPPSASIGDCEFCTLPPNAGVLMQHHKFYFIGHDGRFFKAIDLSCEDDSAAIAATKPLIDGHDLELGQRDRRIARFDGTPS